MPGTLLTVSFVALLSVFVAFVRSRRDMRLDVERTIAVRDDVTMLVLAPWRADR